MSITIDAAGAADVEEVARFLNRHMDSSRPVDSWRRIMDYPWLAAKPNRGFVARDGERMVGYIGGIYADRMIGGHRYRLCNMTSIYVLREYRGQRLARRLHEAIIADPAVTCFVFIPSSNVVPVTGNPELGFRIFDIERYVWIPGASPEAADGVELILDKDAVRAALDDDDRQIMDDHADCDLINAVMRSAEGNCYIALAPKRKGESITYYESLSVRNAAAFVAGAQALADSIGAKTGAALVADRKFFPGMRLAQPVERTEYGLFLHSRDLDADAIDYLYSEIPLLA